MASRSEKLTPEQAYQLLQSMQPHKDYPLRLRDRLRERQFPAGDPIRAAAEEICEALQRLTEAALSTALSGKSKRNGRY